jgi:hypothetical protein
MEVFLSYSSADSQWAEKLIKIIKGRGLSVWTAERDLKQGQHWQDELERALDSACAIVLLVGPKSAHSKTQQMEWRAALEESWTHSFKPLLPVLIKGAELPKFLIPWTSKALHIPRNSQEEWQKAVDVLTGAIESYKSLPRSSGKSMRAANFDPPPFSSAAGDPEPPGVISEREERLSYIEEAARSIASEATDEDPPRQARPAGQPQRSRGRRV